MITQQPDILQFAELLDALPDAVFWLKAVRNSEKKVVDFQIDYVNQNGRELAEDSCRLQVGASLLSANPDEWPTMAQSFQALLDVLMTGQGQGTTFFDATRQRWFHIDRTKLGDGVLSVIRDVSESQRAIQQSEEQANLLQTIINNSPAAIVLYEPIQNEVGQIVDFRYKLVNPMAALATGRSLEYMQGNTLFTMFPVSAQKGFFDRLCTVVQTGDRQQYEHHFADDAVDLWADISMVRQGGDVLTVFQYITDLKRAQQQSETSVTELQRSNKNLEQFAYVASHDLQEPLRKIQAFGDLLQTQYAPVLEKEGADMIQRMQSAASRMQVLIKDILAYSRIATRQESAVTVDLNLVVQNVLSDLESTISDKQAIISLDPLPTLTGDSSQVHQLFLNLFSNALKFTRPDVVPTLTVTSRIVQGRDVDWGVGLQNNDQLFYLIEVSDNGIGFEAHLATRIFDVFQRLHSRHSYEGTGIGLAVVQKVVQNHHGYITAEGKPGEGATFRILLPVS